MRTFWLLVALTGLALSETLVNLLLPYFWYVTWFSVGAGFGVWACAAVLRSGRWHNARRYVRAHKVGR